MIKLSIIPAIAAIALIGSTALVQAQGYSTTFPNTTFTGAGNPLSGQGGWATNDPYVNPPGVDDDYGETSFVNWVSGWSQGTTSASGDLSVSFGGAGVASEFFPGVSTPELSHTFTPYTVLDGPITFSVDFGVIGGGTDSFSWSLRDTTGADLLSITFNPNAATVADLRVQWYDGTGVLQTTGSNPALLQNRELTYSQQTKLTVVLNPGGLSPTLFDAYVGDYSAQRFQGLTNNVQIIAGGKLGDADNIADVRTVANFGEIATVWTLDSPIADGQRQTGAGNNYILFDNVSVVPEPSSAALLLAGGTLLLGRRRRK